MGPTANGWIVTKASQEVFGDVGAGLDGARDANFHARFDRGVHPGFHAIADDRSEFHTTRVDFFPLDHRHVVATVMTMIFGAGSRAEGHMGADDRIAHIALPGNVAVVVEDG